MNTCVMKYKWPMETYSISVAVRKIQINQTTLRSYLTAFRIITNKTKQNKPQQMLARMWREQTLINFWQ